MRFIKSPELRLEDCRAGMATVLEGAELACLLQFFVEGFKGQIGETDDFWETFLLSILRSYERLYEKVVVSQALDALEHPSRTAASADARKLDLFFRGMLWMMAEVRYPEEKWESVFGNSTSILDIIRESVSFKPSIFGFGIDVKLLIEKVWKRFKGSN